MQEFLLAIAAVVLIGLTLDLLIKVMSAALKITIAILILIATFITLAIAFS